MAPQHRPHSGFTLLELLIGLAVGLFVLASASMLMLAQLSDHRRMTLETRTEQDLRALAELMARELREAGRWQSPAQGVWHEAAAAIANPYAGVAVSPDGSRVEFSLSSADALGRDDNLVSPAERRGFKLEAGVLRFLHGGAGWQPLSDPQTLRLNALRFELVEFAQALPEVCELSCDSLADCPPRLLRQQLQVRLEAQPAHDARVQRRLEFSLPLQTEKVEGAMPLMKSQHGATTLITVMGLFFVMTLVAAYANRQLLIEQSMARGYQRLGIAQEGSQQAVARVLSLLNSGKLDAECRPTAGAGASLRERLLQIDADGLIGLAAATPAAPDFSLVCDRRRPDGDWRCQCPDNLRPLPQPAAGDGHESLLARLAPSPDSPRPPGHVLLQVRACTDTSAACAAAGTGDAGHSTRQQHLQLLSALKMPPSSALVAAGAVDLGDGLGVVSNDAQSAGIALQAGGEVLGLRERVQGPAGAAADGSLLTHQSSLATLDAEHLFRRHFGMAMSSYRQQPAVRELRCAGDCEPALAALAARGTQLVWHRGDLHLSRALALGRAEAPLLLVVDGDLRIDGPLQLQGLLFVSGNLQWQPDAASPSWVRGALLVGGSVSGGRAATALYDPSLLQALRLQAGSFIRLPGGTRRGA